MKRPREWFRANRIQRPPCRPPGFSVRHFELKSDLALGEGQAALAYVRTWDLSGREWETVLDDDKVFTVYAMLGKHEGRGRGSFYGFADLAGSLGTAFLGSSGLWEVLDMQPAAQMVRAQYDGGYNPGGDPFSGAWNITALQPVIPLGSILVQNGINSIPIEYSALTHSFSTVAAAHLRHLGMTGGPHTEPGGLLYAVRFENEILSDQASYSEIVGWEIVNYARTTGSSY